MNEQNPRAALVTGGTKGLGRAAATELGRRGWSIYLQHDSGAAEAAEAVADVRDAAAEAGAVIEVAEGRFGLTAGAGREACVEAVLEAFGRIDVLVSAAPGLAGAADDLLEITEEAYRAVLDAGVTATLFLTQLVANEMVRLVEAGAIENPKIVLLNSIGAYTTSIDYAPHCISRAGLAMVTQLFADRLGEHGINVYEVRVGLISPSPDAPSRSKYDALIQEGLTPVRRWGRPEEVARAVAAIAEDLLSFSTGEVVNVDGGFHLRRM